MSNSQTWLADGKFDSPLREEKSAEIKSRRMALKHLHTKGGKLVAMIRWSRNSWIHGARNQMKLPLDLTEAYEHCRKLAFTYGDLIDAWEVENEPDIAYVPENAETFAAFYKACSLGIIAGREAAEGYEGGTVKGRKSELVTRNQILAASEDTRGSNPDLHTLSKLSTPSHLQTTRAASAVMHSPMALPPGPYWDELVANDTLSYTEAFNYHYYGYAEDFKGVRDAWVSALNRALRVEKHGSIAGKVVPAERSNLSTLVQTEPPSYLGQSPLPLFLTEYGFGLLDRFDRHTVEGRERQKRFFEITLPSITDGTITGAMAFVFMPWMSEVSIGNEFGLLAEIPTELLPVAQSRQSRKLSAEPTRSDAARERVDGAIEQSRLTPMREVTELVAFKASERTKPNQSLSPPRTLVRPESSRSPDLRRLDSAELSPVVIDFVSGENTQSVKRYNGHLLLRREAAAEVSGTKEQVTGLNQAPRKLEQTTMTLDSRRSSAAAEVEGQKSKAEGQYGASSGEFTLVVYNFSDEPITGKLSISLENGLIELMPEIAAPSPSVHKQGRSAQQPTSPDSKRQDKSADSSAKASATTEASAKADQPYVRPPVPRSSLRPVNEPNWPHADTPTIITESGRSYAVTPALEFLMEAAGRERLPSVPHNAQEENSGLKKKQNTQEWKNGLKDAGYSDTLIAHSKPYLLVGDAETFSPSHLQRSINATELTLQPMERRELKFAATLPNQEFRGHRLSAIWETSKTKDQQVASAPSLKIPENEKLAESAPTLPAKAGTVAAARPPSYLPTLAGSQALLASQLYPSPSAFRMNVIERFAFTPKDNAEARARQLARPRVEGEAKLSQHPSAKRWLSTLGVEIEETLTGWRITVNDLPPESLRPAEIELPLPDGWTFPNDAALSFRYRLVSTLPTIASSSEQHSTSRPSDSGLLDRDPSRSNRFEEFDVNLRDNSGTLWSVWPRLLARKATESYLESAGNFTPMFFSRAPFRNARNSKLKVASSQQIFESLVIMFRPRVIPTTIEVLKPQIAELEPIDLSIPAR